MLQASDRNPKITYAIRSIKKYLKEFAIAERHDKLAYRENERQLSILRQPFIAEYNNIKSNYKGGYFPFPSFFYYQESLPGWIEYKEKAAKLLPAYTASNFTVSDFNKFDITLIHILYNRLRNSTKSHLGSKENDDAYINRLNQIYFSPCKGAMAQYQALTVFVESLGEVSVEACKEQSHAS